MRKLMFTAAVLITAAFFSSCEKENFQPINNNNPGADNTETSSAPSAPYQIPEVNTETDYSTVVYIDPGAGSNGNGSLSSPLSELPSNLQPNTAYLLKRGTSHSYISRKFDNVLLGAYGQGEKPRVNGMEVQNYSQNSTIRDLDIARTPSSDWDKVLEFNHQNSSSDITIAYCKIRGIESNGRYPQYALHHAVDGLVLFNNEIFNAQNNGWWLTPHSNVKVIRNWFHHLNKGGENSTNSSGDGIQAEYGFDGLYFAGNILDKSNAMWKYGLMLNGHQKDNVVEYNTFYPPKSGAGGAGVRWMAQEGGIFRKNVVRAICDQGNQLVVPFDTWDSHANKPAPYGIRDNIVITVAGAGVATNGVTLDESNKHIIGMQEYHNYINSNPGIGQYGSDITAENFWNGPEETTTPPTYSLSHRRKLVFGRRR